MHGQEADRDGWQCLDGQRTAAPSSSLGYEVTDNGTPQPKIKRGQREGSVGIKRESERQNEVLIIATEAWADVGLEKARLTWRHNRAAFSVGAEAKA